MFWRWSSRSACSKRDTTVAPALLRGEVIKRPLGRKRHSGYVKLQRAKDRNQNGHSGCSNASCLVSCARQASERSSITPGAMQVTHTRVPGLNPARSSQRPMRRILGLVRRLKKSPSSSIFNVRKEGLRSLRLGGSCESTAFLSLGKPQ